MEHFIDIYNKKPDLVEKLLSLDNVKVNLKVDGKPFQVLVENNEIHYHGRSGDESHIGPEIDEYTRLFSAPINYAISVVEENSEAFKNYKFMTFEVINDNMLLTAVVDNDERFVESASEIRDIANQLGTDVMPTLWEGKLTEFQIDSIVNILESGIVPEKENLINWVKEQFGDYEFFPENLISAADDFIEGLVFFFNVGNKIVEYKIVDPTYRDLMNERKKNNEVEFEKNKEVYESIYNIFVDFAENTDWHKNENKIQNLQENFEEMMSLPKTYNKLMNLGSKIKINESKTYSIQVERLNESLAKDIRIKGNIYKQLFESFVKLFYKPKKRGYIISKEFQTRVNNIIESSMKDKAEELADQYLVKYHGKNALEFKNNIEKDGWVLDLNYDNWTAGESVTLKYTKDNEKLYVEYSLRKNNTYKGEITDDELSKLKVIENSEYYKK